MDTAGEFDGRESYAAPTLAAKEAKADRLVLAKGRSVSQASTRTILMMEHQKIPPFGRTKIARQREESATHVHIRVSESVQANDIPDQRQEPVHVLAGGHSGAFALVGFAALDLFLAGGFAAPPERLGGPAVATPRLVGEAITRAVVKSYRSR